MQRISTVAYLASHCSSSIVPITPSVSPLGAPVLGSRGLGTLFPRRRSPAFLGTKGSAQVPSSIEREQTRFRNKGVCSCARPMALRAVRSRQKAAAVRPYVCPATAAVSRPISTHTSNKFADMAAFPLQKKYGQHLLKNPGILDKILAAANITSSDVVLEIGPGGAKTVKFSCHR